MSKQTIRRALPYALFAVLVCVFLWRPIFTGRALLPGDYLAQMAPWSSVVKADPANHAQWNPLQWDAIAQFYPWRVFYASSMRSGHIPLWNPHQFCGTPFLANGQSACLYPPNLVFLIFDPITAFTVFAALHLFLAQMFMYWLMRELGAKELGGIVAAIVFAFSAFMVLWLELPTFVSVAVWLPLALMLVQRAVTLRSAFHGMLSGAAIGIAFLAGHFQIAFYVVLATGLWWLWKMVEVWREEGKTYTFLKVGVPLIGCVVIAGLIAAPQILPTQELAANSHRVREVTEEGYQSFIDNALPAYRLVTAFAPGFFGAPSRGDYYLLGRIGDSRHVGSAADYMEYGMYAGILPLMLALIALGSIRKKHVGFFVVLAVLALLTATGTPINRLFYFGIPGFSALGGPNRILLLYLFGMAALAGFGTDWLTALRSLRLLSSPLFGALVVVVVIADLFAFGINYNPTCDRSKVYPETKLTTELKRLTKNGERIAPINPSWSLFETPKAILPPNAAMVYGLYDVQGYDSLYTKAYQSFMAQVEGIDPSPPENGNMVLLRILPREQWMVSTAAYYLSNRPLNTGKLRQVRRVNDVFILSTGYQGDRPFAVTYDGNPSGNVIYGRFRTANRADIPLPKGRFDVSRDMACSMPGWFGVVKDQVAPPSVLREGTGSLLLSHNPVRLDRPEWLIAYGPTTVTLSYEPFSFRLGLFLMLIGVGALSCVGVHRAMRYRIAAQR